MIWSPLAGGQLFAAQDARSVRLKAMLEQVAQAHQATVDQIMYAWIYRCPAPLCAINGSFKPARVRQAAEASDIELSRLEWFRILEASRGFSVP